MNKTGNLSFIEIFHGKMHNLVQNVQNLTYILNLKVFLKKEKDKIKR